MRASDGAAMVAGDITKVVPRRANDRDRGRPTKEVIVDQTTSFRPGNGTTEFFEAPVGFLHLVPVQRLGEREGADGIAVLIALMCAAGRRGTSGLFTTNVAELAQEAFVSDLTALRCVLSARDRRRIPQRIREFVFRRDNGVCGLCGNPIESGQEVHLDHIIPWSRGGSDLAENLQVAHGACNRSKGARF